MYYIYILYIDDDDESLLVGFCVCITEKFTAWVVVKFTIKNSDEKDGNFR